MSMTRESITDERVSMEWFAGVLEGVLGRPVRDKTGFTGSFQVHLEYAPVALGTANDTTKPSIFTALEEQLGLRLESQKGSEEVLVGRMTKNGMRNFDARGAVSAMEALAPGDVPAAAGDTHPSGISPGPGGVGEP